MLVVLSCIISDDISTKRMSCENEIRYLTKSLSPQFKHLAEIVNGILWRLVEQVVLGSATTTHTDNVHENDAILFSDLWDHLVKKGARGSIPMYPYYFF